MTLGADSKGDQLAVGVDGCAALSKREGAQPLVDEDETSEVWASWKELVTPSTKMKSQSPRLAFFA